MRIDPIAPADDSGIPTFGEFSQSISVDFLAGALVGGGYFLGVRLVQRIGLVNITQEFQAKPHILFGAVTFAIYRAAQLTYRVMLDVLGDRHIYENLIDPENETLFNRMRQRTWRCVTQFENLQKNIDVVYSRIFGIRTEETIRKRYADEKAYYLDKPRIMEITRKVFFENFFQSASFAALSFGVHSFRTIGFRVVFPLMTVRMQLFMFGIGLANGVLDVFNNVMTLENEELETRLREAAESTVSVRIDDNSFETNDEGIYSLRKLFLEVTENECVVSLTRTAAGELSENEP